MFKKTKTNPITEPYAFPSGSVVVTEKGYFFIKGELRLLIPTTKVRESWRFPRIIEARESAMTHHILGGKLGFRDGTLLRNFADGKTYLVSGSKLRHIKNPNALKYLGATQDDILVVSDAEIRLHKVGEEIE